jgi:uncharacterized protein (TIGR00730 family)
MKRICVFCGSSRGADSGYVDVARRLGAILAERGLSLVYGGGNIGLMGELADAVLTGGGRVVGVIPEALEARELAHTGVQDLRVVGSMHERKALMADLADAFIALPGGLGTLEEFCEIITWAQLGIHDKPCGLLNARDFFQSLIAFLDHAVTEGFLRPEHRALVFVESEPEVLLERFETYRAPKREKWIDRDQT